MTVSKKGAYFPCEEKKQVLASGSDVSFDAERVVMMW
jgi:hypothetical protein